MIIKELEEQREENFKKIGQYQLQKFYYEQGIEELLKKQQELCDRIYQLEKGNAKKCENL